jgi:tRNA(fMet)-specific endonuclease VapC
VKLAIDTNAYRLMMDGDAAAQELARTADVLAMPVPVIAELRYGFANGTRGRRNEAALAKFLDTPRVEILVCDDQTTRFYAELKLQLKRAGTPIPINDVWIAALALQHGATLFTRDSDFDRIPQLPTLKG